MPPSFKFKEAKSNDDYLLAAALFKEYAAQLGVDLNFQNFDFELNNLDKQYSRPDGVIFIALNEDGQAIGCFGIRKLDTGTAELKRMYLKNEARGLGLGKFMLNTALYAGKSLGYLRMRLDTLPFMKTAIKLYESIGFYEIMPYRYNPIEGTKYLEINLENYSD